MDLTKAFDCIPYDLLIAKLYARDLSQETTTFFYSYLKRRQQSVRIDDIISLCKFWCQRPVLGQILFHIFLNDLVQVLKNSDIYNFADDNAISVVPKNRDTLLETLINKSRLVVNWFRNNNLIVNPNKLMLLQKFGDSLYRQPPSPTRSVEF